MEAAVNKKTQAEVEIIKNPISGEHELFIGKKFIDSGKFEDLAKLADKIRLAVSDEADTEGIRSIK